MKPTRTLNPLPFQDLEPHRFEDLVRQLAYDLRRWRALEATGRSGSDAGMDVRGIESVRVEDETEDDDDNTPMFEERLWVFQCKREKTLGPKRVHEVVEESLVSLPEAPHGFVLAVAADVSKKARDTFRKEMVARGIEEFELWAKGELEDMLFQPKNDRLLFAYFGLSLQPRRRSLSTTLRSHIAKKKQLATLLGNESEHGRLVLLRDPTDERYPRTPKEGDAPAKWLTCWAITLKEPGYLQVLRSEYLAATTPDGERWDALLQYDVARTRAESELQSMSAWGLGARSVFFRTPEDDFWNEFIPAADRAHLKVYLLISIDQILAIDPLGDGYFPVPHILLAFDATSSQEFAVLERSPYAQVVHLTPQKSNRASIFPDPLPSNLVSPPTGFDDTTEVVLPISGSVDDKLSALLATIATSRKPIEAPIDDPVGRLEQSRSKMRPFREWRATVAQPLFSAFVRRLRAEGHGARVVVRSQLAPSHNAACESVEFRVQLLGNLYNPTFHPSGHVRVLMSEHTGWQLEVSPSPDEPQSREATREVEAMTKEQLEEEVMAMLDRVRQY